MLAAINALIGPVSAILDKVIPDKDLREKLSHEIATMADRQMSAQIAVNREEAKGNWFQSSWRPATAWVCVAGIAINFLVSPLAAPFGIIVPQVDTAVTMPLLLGLLGLTTARTYERIKKVGKE